MKRAHGLILQPRWDGQGLPPVQQSPPNPGTVLLELNFPFFFKLTSGVMLGPRCNHDLGILLRLPVLSSQHAKLLLDDFADGDTEELSSMDLQVYQSSEKAIAKVTGLSIAASSSDRVDMLHTASSRGTDGMAGFSGTCDSE